MGKTKGLHLENWIRNKLLNQTAPLFKQHAFMPSGAFPPRTYLPQREFIMDGTVGLFPSLVRVKITLQANGSTISYKSISS
jgi:hypothetical protein